MSAEKVGLGSHKKALWLCPEGHEFEREIRGYAKSPDCPYCTGKIITPGVNDLGTKSPKAAQYWDAQANKKPITEFTEFSNSLVSWKCELGHQWKQKVADFVRKDSACPYCNNSRLLPGFNDYATVMGEHKYQPADKSLAGVTMFRSQKRTVWECPEGHQWEQSFYRISVEKRNCPYCVGQRAIPGVNSMDVTHPHLAAELCEEESGFTAREVMAGSDRVGVWQCARGHKWKARCNGRMTSGYGCARCCHIVSNSEQEVYDYIKTIYTGTIIGSHKIPNRQEIDIYLPELNLGIEYNGVLWHSTKYKHKNYHLNKRKYCEQQGVRLLQIWEDDWKNKQEIVKRLLAHKLGVSTAQVAYARKTTPLQVTSQEAQEFMENNHIQGFVNGSWYIGLQNQEKELIALSILRKRPNNNIEMVRYATSHRVIGGFQKIVRHIEKTLTYDTMFTFADLDISDGGLYCKAGWEADKQLPPDYKYLWKDSRHHKFKFRKIGFKNNPELRYEEGLTETQLAELNNLHRVYDSGKIRFKKERRKA